MSGPRTLVAGECVGCGHRVELHLLDGEPLACLDCRDLARGHEDWSGLTDVERFDRLGARLAGRMVR